jgi:hypothetical protein
MRIFFPFQTKSDGFHRRSFFFLSFRRCEIAVCSGTATTATAAAATRAATA